MSMFNGFFFLSLFYLIRGYFAKIVGSRQEIGVRVRNYAYSSENADEKRERI